MASVNLLNVEILNGETLPFSSTFRFQITFECVAEISDDLVREALWSPAPSTHHTRYTQLHPARPPCPSPATPDVRPPPLTPHSPARRPAGLARGVRGQRQGQGL
jgi:hypothetical protein